MTVRSLHKTLFILALFALLAGSGRASSLTINLPLVSGVPTLSGVPGEVVNVNGTITVGSTDSPLVLGDIDVRETTSEGVSVGTDTSVYYDPGNNFFAAGDPSTPLQPGSTTTGGLLTISFPTISPASISTIFYDITYNDTSHLMGSFQVNTVVTSAPEPAYTGAVSLALGFGWYYRRRRLLSRPRG